MKRPLAIKWCLAWLLGLSFLTGFARSANYQQTAAPQQEQEIRNQYTLTYMPQNTKHDGSYRVIQVKARRADREKLRVRTRAGYFAPSKP
ncbi:MAG TPA: hypothetical protein VFZ34_08190 [Blastocatellia bacterium]|nr:hypothetical protein [Blastocatellia bacterium]